MPIVSWSRSRDCEHGPYAAHGPNVADDSLRKRRTSSKKVRSTCPVDPAKGCIECHMPSAWQQSTHSFKTDHFIRVRDRLTPKK